MSRMEIADFEALFDPPGQALLAELGGGHYTQAAALPLASKLRERYPASLVATALTQARLRERARAKFGDAAATMYFTPVGLEQATRRSVAELRARRYRAAGVRRVADLGCGIGGDALAFAAAGIEVLAVDRDPVTSAVAAANARAAALADRIEVRCADATKVALEGFDAVFLDPARRAEHRRVFDPAAYTPPWSFALELARRVGAAGFKVAPGLPRELIPAGAEAEWVSEAGEVKEAGIYFGPLAGAHRRATVLPGPHSLVSAGVVDPEPAQVGRYLYEPDGAVICAHVIGELAGQLDATTIDATIAYLTSDRLVLTPFATAYRITDVLPFHVKRLRAEVARRGIGVLTVKKRGADVDPAVLRRQLKPSGPNSAVLIVTRVLGAHTALFAQPATPGQ
ncbi:class I SAM-dependent methyltransferase [Actinocrinis puniceicyclus]|uniref:Class I SAM-dependent methyltransferase n=1 Tax=Actinocrinis puniceicyclus TaxID=977794 RepID=A0A8J7WPT1_9ACTN|nr:class I SAM-dependent methyltransferase [Actinocrinis puniceicyclus]MBS2964122.1 class I SAM-dependent methyltransferase [Actinocrinis puniceicyclus]